MARYVGGVEADGVRAQAAGEFEGLREVAEGVELGTLPQAGTETAVDKEQCGRKVGGARSSPESEKGGESGERTIGRDQSAATGRGGVQLQEDRVERR